MTLHYIAASVSIFAGLWVLLEMINVARGQTFATEDILFTIFWMLTLSIAAPLI